MGADRLNLSRAVRVAYVTCKERNRKHLTRASRRRRASFSARLFREISESEPEAKLEVSERNFPDTGT